MTSEHCTIPKGIATIKQWNKTKGCGVAIIDGLDCFVNKSALRDLETEPEVGDKIIVYKYHKTMTGGRIDNGELATFVSSYTTTCTQTTENVHYSIGCSAAIVIIAVLAILAAVLIIR
ncbi:hypothetical protein [Fibrobacter sp.]|uniref:hypothetical protein n=1 Tax=Fibrobacter sp. TaxID=35828 RepID=UPI003865F2EF